MNTEAKRAIEFLKKESVKNGLHSYADLDACDFAITAIKQNEAVRERMTQLRNDTKMIDDEASRVAMDYVTDLLIEILEVDL